MAGKYGDRGGSGGVEVMVLKLAIAIHKEAESLGRHDSSMKMEGQNKCAGGIRESTYKFPRFASRGKWQVQIALELPVHLVASRSQASHIVKAFTLQIVMQFLLSDWAMNPRAQSTELKVKIRSDSLLKCMYM